MVDFTFQIPQVMFNQLTEYCDSIGEKVEDFVFNLVADKLFTELHGDLNDKMSVSQETKVEKKPAEASAPTVETAKKPAKKQETVTVEEKKPVTIATVSPAPVKIEDKETTVTKKPAVKRTTRTIKTK